ncbi:MAG TPA: TPM domain-containing protein [Thermoanaerobaculia bacterium]|jgi:uncharacterized protein|nr:TPM domain-containing protein [Thermoanaerobaculia bacterium]
MRLRPGLGALALLLLSGLPALPALADKPVPFLSGRVVDEAAMIPADTKRRIEDKLAATEQRTGNQVAVLTVDSLDGEPIEDYSVRVAQTWKLGQKGKDNGVLLVVAKQDRKIRIDVGYSLEPTLTDLETSRIIDLMRPDFQKGDFGIGIEHGVDAMLTALDGGEVPAPPAGQRQGKGVPGDLLTFIIVAVVFILLNLLVNRGRSSRRPWGGGWGGFGGGGFGGGGFSGGGGGGGFSGGGGSFGGGGASGSW